MMHTVLRPAMTNGTAPTVCFFAKVGNPEMLKRVQFYGQDLEILRRLGYHVRIATRFRDLCVADLYYVWWWTWAFAPLLYARWLRRPCVISGVVNWHEINKRPWWHRQLIEYSLRNASANIFLSQLEFENVTSGVRVSNPHYSPLAVDTEKYSPRAVVRDDSVFTIAWMHTRNAERKCMPEVIQAAALVHRTHPHVRFVVAGEQGTAYPALVALRNRLGAQAYVEFAGIISEEEKIERLRRCGVYLQPSRFEGFGLAILEAMSCGTPVISSPVGAVPEVLGDTGIYVDGTAPREIARAICDLFDRRLSTDLAWQARQRAVHHFSFARRQAELQRLLAELLGVTTWQSPDSTAAAPTPVNPRRTAA